MAANLRVRPLSLRQANSLVAQWHRHHKPVQGMRFAVGVYDGEGACHGAAIVGRPVARMTDQWRVAEVVRLVTDGTANACSVLYGACARAARALGFERIQTFIFESESGVSLRAAGWVFDGYAEGGYWDRPSRQRERDDITTERKQRWVVRFAANALAEAA